MSSIDNQELFEKYYQNEYDFDTVSLSKKDLTEIKKFVHEKRVDYALAPMGTDIFDWISKQSPNIKFEMIDFDSDKIDGMLYIPSAGQERAYIILNSKKPLVNQIFTAAHEYYHYAIDYQKTRKKHFICNFSELKDVNEKKASRFAAEMLLPEDAIKYEVNTYCAVMRIKSPSKMDFNNFAALIILLTIQYQMPLKAVIYRLYEERYIDDIHKYIDNYGFIKTVAKRIKILQKQVSELYSTNNDFIHLYFNTYEDMEKAYLTGNASKEDIIEDGEKLNLDMNFLYDFMMSDEEADEADDDDELLSIMKEMWG